VSDSATTLGKYQIIREIARSNDIVYEAYDPLMNRRVALKELAMPGGLNAAQQEDRRNRFLREARAAGTLTHPNIVTVYEYGEEAGRHFIAMEFLDGHTLRNELDTHGFLPLDRAFEVGKSVLAALEFAHNGGVVHRDIKPENIQLMTDGRVKITDFGIARLTFEPNLTMDGQVFGTPSYMSPEQVVGREIDARSDLFSLGVVLYEMISGRKPFQGDSVVSITYAIMNNEPEQPQQANYAVWQVLQRAMDKSPALRYSSAKEMREALDEAERASKGQVLDPMHGANPYSGTAMPPVAGQPYNPYGSQPSFQIGNAPPIGNPYVNMPYPPAPTPNYPYNPYQAGPPGTGPTMGTPGFPPVPVYYPPPPRPPLITPEMKGTMARVFVAFLVIGTILTLAVVGVSYFAKALAEQKSGGPAVSRTPNRSASSAGGSPAVTSNQPRISGSGTPVSPGPGAEVSVPAVTPQVDDRTPVSSAAEGYDEREANRLFLEANALAETDVPAARQKLYEARRRCPPDSDLFGVIEAMILVLSER
jgi:eukaryotic-like serine/threonine-protein kinase